MRAEPGQCLGTHCFLLLYASFCSTNLNYGSLCSHRLARKSVFGTKRGCVSVFFMSPALLRPQDITSLY
ncbi:hypothetical protein PBY51_023448 [Eleginops maclovinus]|uniref:Secreted protein n=1 Tax=Eleginops maclovinus TaxID=56733 RepID=A0AAN7X305_ELEMC|nr:hypothetical protein PBY51_023448 [Eleginops maclovinus]